MSTDRLTTTSYVVLGLIGLRGPSTSYDLKRAIGRSVGFFWPFPHAQLYSEPRRLVKMGMLELSTEDQGRRRQTFTLTDAGRQAVEDWLAEPESEPMQVRDVAELKLFFGELAGDGDLQALARNQIRQHRERIRTYDDMSERYGSIEGVASRMVPLRLGLRMEHAALDFWEELEAELDGADRGRSAG